MVRVGKWWEEIIDRGVRGGFVLRFLNMSICGVYRVWGSIGC